MRSTEEQYLKYTSENKWHCDMHIFENFDHMSQNLIRFKEINDQELTGECVHFHCIMANNVCHS